MYYVAEKCSRPNYYDRFYSPSEYRSERQRRRDAGVSWFETAIVEADEKPDSISTSDDRILSSQEAGEVMMKIRDGEI